MSSSGLSCPCLQPRRWLQLCLLAPAVLGVAFGDVRPLGCNTISFALDNEPDDAKGTRLTMWASYVRDFTVLPGEGQQFSCSEVPNTPGREIFMTKAGAKAFLFNSCSASDRKMTKPVDKMVTHWQWTRTDQSTDTTFVHCTFKPAEDFRGITHTLIDKYRNPSAEGDAKQKILDALTGANQETGITAFFIDVSHGFLSVEDPNVAEVTGICALRYESKEALRQMLDPEASVKPAPSEFNCAVTDDTGNVRYAAVPLLDSLTQTERLAAISLYIQSKMNDAVRAKLNEAFNKNAQEGTWDPKKTVAIQLASPKSVEMLLTKPYEESLKEIQLKERELAERDRIWQEQQAAKFTRTPGLNARLQGAGTVANVDPKQTDDGQKLHLDEREMRKRRREDMDKLELFSIPEPPSPSATSKPERNNAVIDVKKTPLVVEGVTDDQGITEEPAADTPPQPGSNRGVRKAIGKHFSSLGRCLAQPFSALRRKIRGSRSATTASSSAGVARSGSTRSISSASSISEQPKQEEKKKSKGWFGKKWEAFTSCFPKLRRRGRANNKSSIEA